MQAPLEIQLNRVWTAVEEAFCMKSSAEALWGTPLSIIPWVLAFRTAELDDKTKAIFVSRMKRAGIALRGRAAGTLGAPLNCPDYPEEAPTVADF